VSVVRAVTGLLAKLECHAIANVDARRNAGIFNFSAVNRRLSLAHH
jgi:hypothetical protein